MKKFFKILFLALPFKKAIFSLLKKVALPENVYKHLYFIGVFEVKVDENNFKILHQGHQIENQLFWKGIDDCWEKNSVKIWKDLSAKSNIIFDVGANTGVYSLIAKTVNNKSSVHAFEPFPSIYKTLLKNAELNHYDIHCNCAAVSNYKGQGVIYSEDPDFAYSVTVNKNLWAKDEKVFEIPITTTTLKNYIEEHQISRIDLMKIDVETHEPEVMEGFACYFSKFKPIILIEILNEEVAEKLSAFFPIEYFEFYNIDEEKGISKASILTKSELFNFLIIPKEKAAYFDFEKYISYS
jgi:FkbM family methyltransferase